jgi:hypothetical protein
VPPTDETTIHPTGVLHAIKTTGNLNPIHFWIVDIQLHDQAAAALQQNGYDRVGFTPYSSPDRWAQAHPTAPLHATTINSASL